MVLSAQDFVWQNHRQAPARAVHASIKIPVDRSQAAGEQCAGLLLLPARIHQGLRRMPTSAAIANMADRPASDHWERVGTEAGARPVADTVMVPQCPSKWSVTVTTAVLLPGAVGL